jgi:hypothetical protein
VKATNLRGSITTWGHGTGNRDGFGHRRIGEGCSEGEAPERKRFSGCLQLGGTSEVDSRCGNAASESKELCSQGIFDERHSRLTLSEVWNSGSKRVGSGRNQKRACPSKYRAAPDLNRPRFFGTKGCGGFGQRSGNTQGLRPAGEPMESSLRMGRTEACFGFSQVCRATGFGPAPLCMQRASALSTFPLR